MGREVKRVSLDFKWPMNQIWEGFINPHYEQCPKCDGSGSTNASKRLKEIVSLLMLSGSDSLTGETHPYFHGANFNYARILSKDMAELTEGLAGRKLSSTVFGHDSIDNWSAEKKIIAAAGLSKDWGICRTCEGEGMDPGLKEKYEAWKDYEPPNGEGWQMWENVSEGSPISPVFESPEKLAQWLADNNASSFGDMTATYEQWLSMIDVGWAMSGVMQNGVLKSGVEAIADQE